VHSSLSRTQQRLKRFVLAGVLCLGLAGCETNSPDSLPSDCPPESVLTWDNFGEPFLLTWCTPCHSSHLSGEGDPNERQDAPIDSNFDTYSQYMDWDAEVWNRAAADNDSMPPAGGPSPEDRAMLAEWIACGSPQ
jgi:hypothetical protein